MNSINHITSFYASPWVGWVMFVLLFVALLNPLSQNVRGMLQGIFSHSERTYAVHGRDWTSEIALRFFRIGILALTILIWLLPQNACSLLSYLKTFGILIAVYIVQTLLLYGVGKVFISSKLLDAAMEQYNGIRTLTCVWLFPVLLLLLNITTPVVHHILCGITLGLYLLLLFGKSIQLFYAHPLSIIYILLYIVYLEILPLFGSVLMVERIL